MASRNVLHRLPESQKTLKAPLMNGGHGEKGRYKRTDPAA